MKKLQLLLAFTLACVLWSCDDDKTSNNDFYIVESKTSLPAISSSGYIKVSAQATVTAQADQPWCAVNVSGDIVNITLSQNSDMTERYSMVTLTSGNKSLRVPVIQYGTVTQFSAIDTIRVTYVAQTREYTLVSSTVPVTVSLDQTWVTATVDGDNNITLDFTENADDERIAHMTVNSGNDSKVFVIVQATIFGVDKTELTFYHDGTPATQTVTVTYAATPTVDVPAADTWCTATFDGTSTITVSCPTPTTVARSTTITVTSGTATRTFDVIQMAPPVYADYIGTWKCSGADFVTGAQVEYTLTITQKVAGTSYNVKGWAVNATLGAAMVEMLFDTSTGGVILEGFQNNLGTAAYTICFIGYYPSTSASGQSPLTGTYDGMKGIKIGSSVQWVGQDVIVGGGTNTTIHGIALRMINGTSIYNYTDDAFVLVNPKMTKQ